MEEDYGRVNLNLRTSKLVDCQEELDRMAALFCSEGSTGIQDYGSDNNSQVKPSQKSFQISLMERKNKVSLPEQKQSTQSIRQKTAKRLQRENLNITDYFRSRKRTKPDWIEDKVLQKQHFTFDSNLLEIDSNECTFDGYNASNPFTDSSSLLQKRKQKVTCKAQGKVNKIDLTKFKVFGRESSRSPNSNSSLSLNNGDQDNEIASNQNSQANLSLMVSADQDSLQTNFQAK